MDYKMIKLYIVRLVRCQQSSYYILTKIYIKKSV